MRRTRCCLHCPGPRRSVLRYRVSKYGVPTLIICFASPPPPSLALKTDRSGCGNAEELIEETAAPPTKKLNIVRVNNDSLGSGQCPDWEHPHWSPSRFSDASSRPVYPTTWQDDFGQAVLRACNAVAAGLSHTEVHQLLTKLEIPQKWTGVLRFPHFRWRIWSNISQIEKKFPALRQFKQVKRASVAVATESEGNPFWFQDVSTASTKALSEILLLPKDSDVVSPKYQASQEKSTEIFKVWTRTILLVAIVYVRYAYNLTHPNLARTRSECMDKKWAKWDSLLSAAEQMEEAANETDPAAWYEALKHYLARLEGLTSCLVSRMPSDGLTPFATAFDQIRVFERSAHGRFIGAYFDVEWRLTRWLAMLKQKMAKPFRLRDLPFWRDSVASLHLLRDYCQSRLPKDCQHLVPLYLFVASLWVSVELYGASRMQQLLTLPEVNNKAETAPAVKATAHKSRGLGSIRSRKTTDEKNRKTSTAKDPSVQLTAADVTTSLTRLLSDIEAFQHAAAPIDDRSKAASRRSTRYFNHMLDNRLRRTWNTFKDSHGDLALAGSTGIATAVLSFCLMFL